MFRSVLLVVDHASIARVVLRAATLPLAVDATITIAERSGHEHSQAMLHALHLLAPGRHVRWISVSHLYGSALREAAEASRAELVVVGDTGLFGWRLLALLGRIPVLHVRSTAVGPFRRPLVAIEPPARALVLLAFLRELFPGRPPHMSAVHVGTVSAERARRTIANALASFGSFGAGWTRYSACGAASTNIVSVARSSRADLVIVGSRARASAWRLLLGSVSLTLMHDVGCDVLAVPMPDAARPLALPVAHAGLP